MIDNRNGQKGMLGTRIIHVLSPLWKSLFAAMVRETVSEGGDEHFLRTQERRSDVRTTMYGLASDYDGEISLELAHRHGAMPSLTKYPQVCGKKQLRVWLPTTCVPWQAKDALFISFAAWAATPWPVVERF